MRLHRWSHFLRVSLLATWILSTKCRLLRNTVLVQHELLYAIIFGNSLLRQGLTQVSYATNLSFNLTTWYPDDSTVLEALHAIQRTEEIPE